MSGPFERQTPDIVGANETLRPLRDGILLEPLDWNPSHVLELVRFGRPLRGIVKAIGPGHYRKVRWIDTKGQKWVKDTLDFIPIELNVGDVVELGGLNIFDGEGYQFQDVMFEGKTHLLCREADVAGVACDGPSQ